MKKLLLSLFILSSSLLAFSQGKWTPRSPLPDSAMFQGIPGFSIGNYGYAGLGDYSHTQPQYNDLWQFDPATNSWIKKAFFPGKARVAPACFVIGNYAYIVCGSVKSSGTCVNECWQYDALNNTWTQKSNFPGGARTYAVGFAIDSLGYVGTGANELSDFYKDFYAYHPSTNTWTKIADFGGIARDGDCGFAVNGKGYVCFGQDSSIKYYKDMWEYNPGTNLWTQKTTLPASPILSASGFAICNNIYVGSGDNDSIGVNHTFWKYSTTLDSWTQEASVPGISKLQGAAFAIGDTGYYGFGCDSIGVVYNIFDKFYAGDSCNINTGVNTITTVSDINIYPNPFKDKCFVKMPDDFTGSALFSLFDMAGTKAETNIVPVNASNIYVLKRNGLKDGIYILSVKYSDKVFYKKLIIMN